MNNDRRDLIRQSVLVTLDQYYSPLVHKELSAILHAHFSLEVEVWEFEELLDFEERDFDNGERRTVWLCPALEPPDFYPDTDFVTRSDWRARDRLVDYEFESERRMWILRRVADDVLGFLERQDDPSPLSELFSELAAGVPDQLLVERSGSRQKDLYDARFVEDIRQIAEDLHGEIVAESRREDFAARVELLELRTRLFGRFDE